MMQLASRLSSNGDVFGVAAVNCDELGGMCKVVVVLFLKPLENLVFYFRLFLTFSSIFFQTEVSFLQ